MPHFAQSKRTNPSGQSSIIDTLNGIDPATAVTIANRIQSGLGNLPCAPPAGLFAANADGSISQAVLQPSDYTAWNTAHPTCPQFNPSTGQIIGYATTPAVTPVSNPVIPPVVASNWPYFVAGAAALAGIAYYVVKSPSKPQSRRSR